MCMRFTKICVESTIVFYVCVLFSLLKYRANNIEKADILIRNQLASLEMIEPNLTQRPFILE